MHEVLGAKLPSLLRGQASDDREIVVAGSADDVETARFVNGDAVRIGCLDRTYVE